MGNISHTWYPRLGVRRGTRLIEGTFFPNNTGAPTFPTLGQTTGILGVKTLVRNGSAGEFLITLDKTYKQLLARWADIQMHTATDLNPQWSDIDVSGAGTLILRLLAAGTPTDVVANANNSVSFGLVLLETDAI